MTIGVIGAGSIGTAFARKLARADIPAILSNSHGPDSLADLIAEIGGAVRAGTRQHRTWCWWRPTGRSCPPHSPGCQILAGAS